MKILIIDSNSSNQARYAERLNSFPAQDVETLDLHIMLLDPANYEEHLPMMDLVVLGSGLGEQSIPIAKKIKDTYPDKNIIIFVSRDNYKGTMIRQAHNSGVRKVMYDLNEDLEFLQELFAIDAEFRRNGKLSYGKVTVFASPKGGAGTTTLAAALAEVSSQQNVKTLLWDVDFTTQDLTRSLGLYGRKETKYLDWINHTEELNLKSIMEQGITVDDNVDLLCPPTAQGVSYDLCYHEEGNYVMQKILDLSRYVYSNVIIDLGDLNSPMANKLLSQADQIVLLTGECVLSITACELFLERSKSFLDNLDKVKIINAGERNTIRDLADSFANLPFSQDPWLSHLPNDKYAWSWPGSGKTLYSAGENATKKALLKIAQELNLISSAGMESEYQTLSHGRVVNMPFFKKRKELPYNPEIDPEELERKKKNQKFTVEVCASAVNS